MDRKKEQGFVPDDVVGMAHLKGRLYGQYQRLVFFRDLLMEEGLRALSYGIRPRFVLTYLGVLALTVAILTLPPLVVSLAYDEKILALRLVGVIAALTAFGIPMIPILPANALQENEALAITALAFILIPVFMAFPLMSSSFPYRLALFESYSAITSTGLTVVDRIESCSRGFLFLRSWMQWYGGLGIAIVSVALFLRHSIAAKRLLGLPETNGWLTSSRAYARNVLISYCVLTIAGVLGVYMFLGEGFHAVVLTLSAVSTGGFSSFDDSLASIDPLSRIAVMLVALAGALPLALVYRAMRGDIRALVADREVLVFLTLIAVSGFWLCTILPSDATGASTRLDRGLLTLSAHSTTGFSALDTTALSAAIQTTIILAMLVGGCGGSSSGGIKVWRIIVAGRLLLHHLAGAGLPEHAWLRLRVEKLSSRRDIDSTVLVFALMFCVIGLSWVALCAYGYPMGNALFEVVSATTNAGLSSGITSSRMSPGAAWILVIDMLLGRLEFIALLIILFPPAWTSKRLKSS